MTDRPFRPAVLTAAAALVLTTVGCTGPAERAEEPSAPTTSASEEPSGSGGTQEPSDDPVADVCDAVDASALGDLGAVTFEPPEPYEEGPNMADGCFLTTEGGGVSVAIDVRTEHGSLEKDLQFITVTGREKPTEVTVAEGPALYVYADPRGFAYSGVVTHAGDDLAVAVVVQNFGEDGVGAEQMEALAVGAAEMVVPVV